LGLNSGFKGLKRDANCSQKPYHRSRLLVTVWPTIRLIKACHLQTPFDRVAQNLYKCNFLRAYSSDFILILFYQQYQGYYFKNEWHGATLKIYNYDLEICVIRRFFLIICKLCDKNIFNMDICRGRRCTTLIATHDVTSIHSHSSQAYSTSRKWRVYCAAMQSCVNFVTPPQHSYRFFFIFFLLWLSFWNRNVLWSDVWQNCRLYLTAFNHHIIKRSNEIFCTNY